jgi:uncharacterized protein YbjT (DUF2867 family)
MARILVIGASRGIGLETVKAALDADHEVRAFARSAAGIALTHPKLERFTGDATSPADVTRALDGVDAVIQSLGLEMGAGYITGTDLFSKSTRVLVDAMTARGVQRLVAVTGLGAGDSRGRLGFLYDAMFLVVLKRVYDDKDVQERIIRSSGLAWTIVRPGILQDGPAKGSYRVLTDPAQWRAGPIRRADVATFLVQEALAPRYLRQTPALIE